MTRNLKDDFGQLSAEEKKQVHCYLCARALEAWKSFALQARQMTYNDSVVGLFHIVELQLPSDAFNAAFGSPHSSSDEIAERYLEPIAALQDMDLEFPDEIQLAYYAIYNAFLKYARHEAIDDWLIVNQAFSCYAQDKDVKSMLQSAMQQAR